MKTCDELVIGRDINAPFLQLVGFEKVGLAQSNYSKLKTISVRNMGVYGSGDNLESYAVANLDIAENLFDSWVKKFVEPFVLRKLWVFYLAFVSVRSAVRHL